MINLDADSTVDSSHDILAKIKTRRRDTRYQNGQWPLYDEHSVFNAAATEVAHEFQVPIEMTMMTALGAMACVCQDMVDVELPPGNKTNPSLMLLTIAKSGERKTTVQKQFFRAITAHNRDALFRYESNLEEYKSEQYLWELEQKELEKAWKKHIQNDRQEKAVENRNHLQRHLNDRPTKPRSQRILYNDATPGALVEAMHLNTPSACLLTSEANSLFKGHALRDLDKINTLWDGDDVIVDRTSRPSFILTDSRLTLSLMAQPVVIEQFLAKRGEEARGIGFLARFITAVPTEKAGTRSTRPIGQLSATQRFNERVQQLLDQYFDEQASNTRPSLNGIDESSHQRLKRPVLTFTSQAKEQWDRYHQEIENQQAPDQALHYYKDHASKLMENVGRMAALVHYFEDVKGKAREISTHTLDFAYDFCRIASQHFQKHLAGTPLVVTDANDVVERLFLEYEKQQDALASSTPPSPERRAHNERSPYTSFENHQPYLGTIGRKHSFKLSFLKQYGPYALRGKSGHQRLIEALNFLKRMGHMTQQNSTIYTVHESLCSSREGPVIRNGIDFTVEQLPLFNEQQYWQAYPDTSSEYDHWQIVT